MAETVKAIQKEMVANYKALTEDEKEIIRANQDTPYAQLLKRVIPTEVFEGLPQRRKAKELVAPAGGLFSSGQGDNPRRGLI